MVSPGKGTSERNRVNPRDLAAALLKLVVMPAGERPGIKGNDTQAVGRGMWPGMVVGQNQWYNRARAMGPPTW